MSADVVICLSTCPDAGTARTLAETLVTEALAACVNQLPGVVSTYRWQGRVQAEPEVLLVIKTTSGRLDALRERLVRLHPYEVPELVVLPVDGGHAPYLDWVRASVAAGGGDRRGRCPIMPPCPSPRIPTLEPRCD